MLTRAKEQDNKPHNYYGLKTPMPSREVFAMLAGYSPHAPPANIVTPSDEYIQPGKWPEIWNEDESMK
jgi:hypothetical protein